MSDPYAGIGTVVRAAPQNDPYAGIATPATAQEPDAPAWQQVAAGAGKGLTGLPDFLGHVFAPGEREISRAVMLEAARRDPRIVAEAARRGTSVEAAVDEAMQAQTAQHWLNRGLGLVGLNPDDVRATTPKSRVLQGVGMGLSGLVIPSGEGVTVANLLRNTVIGAAAGGGAAGAEEAAPDALKPAAGLLGGIAAGLVTHGTMAGAGAAARGAGRGLRSVASAVAPADEALTTALRLPPDAAGVSKPTAAAAADVIRRRSSNPQTVSDMLREPTETVPGSEHTTFQATGDSGLGQLERELKTRNPVPFNEREAEQSSAQTAWLKDVQRDADPNDLAAAVRGNLEGLESQTQAHLADLSRAAEEKAAALGGDAHPEEMGAATRKALADVEDAARTRERGLWQALEEDRKSTANVTETRTAAEQLASELPATAKPMAGEEAAIFETARKLPALAPLGDLIALRGRVAEEMRAELSTNGRTPVYARLTQLNNAIRSNLSTSIAHDIAADDVAVGRGALEADQALGAKIQGWIDEFRQARGAEARTGGGAGAAGVARSAEGAGARPDGAGLPPEGGHGGAAGDQGLPAGPSIDEGAAARLAQATAATLERVGKTGRGPVKEALAKAGPADIYKLPEAKVPEKFFHPGSSAFGHMQALYAAVGKDVGAKLMGEYAALSLKRAAMREGVLEPRAFQRWAAQHADALRALPPEVRARFADAAQASRAVEQASAERAATLKAARTGAVERLLGLTDPAEVSRAIGTILNGRTFVTDIKRLWDIAKGNPEARAGLRQAIVDHMLQKVLSVQEAGASGQVGLKAAEFAKWFDRTRPALVHVFPPDVINGMEAIVADLQRIGRSVNTKIKGSPGTAQDITAQRRSTMTASGATKASVLGFLVERMGSITTHNEIAALTAGLGAAAVSAMRDVGLRNIEDLVTHAMLHPRVAEALLRRFPAEPGGKSSLQLAAALRRSAAATGMTMLAQPGRPPDDKRSH